jgi:hypothetical protein
MFSRRLFDRLWERAYERERVEQALEAQIVRENAILNELPFEGGVEDEPEGIPAVDELLETIEMLTEIVEGTTETLTAARHLMLVLVQTTTAGEPIFKLNVEDDHQAEILRHAILRLNATLEGSDTPKLALTGRTIN